MTDSDDERVTLASSATRSGNWVYHTDPDCQQWPERPTTRRKSDLDDRYTECTFCSGDYEADFERSHDHHKALRDADPSDIGGGR
jgi:hypothetical protein